MQALALEVVAKNYHLYPELTGLSERVKETVSLILNRSSKNQFNHVDKTKIVFSLQHHTSHRISIGKPAARKIKNYLIQ